MEQKAKKKKKKKKEKIRQKELTGLDRRTRDEIVKRNQMTALRFKIVGRHQTSPAPFWGI